MKNTMKAFASTPSTDWAKVAGPPPSPHHMRPSSRSTPNGLSGMASSEPMPTRWMKSATRPAWFSSAR